MSYGQICAGCRYFERVTDSFGTCHRYAPKPNSTRDHADAATVWPEVPVGEWCGDFAEVPTDWLGRKIDGEASNV